MAITFSSANGVMALRAGIVLVFVLGASWVCDARDSTRGVIPHDLVLHQEFDGQAKENLCTMCEEFATEVLDYLEDNSTQTEIIDILYQTCSDLPAIKKQCTTLVDYYVPLVFTEISSVEPKLVCQYVDFCNEEGIATVKKSDEKCTVCQHLMAEVLTKLKDPDTELEIIEVLLKACNTAESRKSVQKCKKLVFKFGPLILESAPQVIEKLNLCTAIRACIPSSSSSDQKYLHPVS